MPSPQPVDIAIAARPSAHASMPTDRAPAGRAQSSTRPPASSHSVRMPSRSRFDCAGSSTRPTTNGAIRERDSPPCSATSQQPLLLTGRRADMPAERRLLYVLPFPPRASAADGGSRAVAENLRRIAASATVAVVYVHEEADPQMDADIAALCDRVDAVTRPRQRRAGPAERALQRLRLATGLLLGTPIWAQALHVPGFERQLAEVAREWSPDLIEIDNHVMGRYLDALDASPAPRVLVVHEPGAGAAGRAWAEPSRMLRALDARAWRIFETRLLRRVQCVVALTEADSQSLRRRGVAVPIETIGLGVSVPERAADPLGGSPPTVLFVGNFRHTPNVDAATRL